MLFELGFHRLGRTGGSFRLWLTNLLDLAFRFGCGCRRTGLALTIELCEVARKLMAGFAGVGVAAAGVDDDAAVADG